MAAKKKAESNDITMNLDLVLKSVDVHCARFAMTGDDLAKLQSDPRVTVNRDMLPVDYEPALYEVSGQVAVTITVKRK